VTRLDEYLPRWDVRTRHERRVAAGAEHVYDALHTTDFAVHPLVRVLLLLRALPAVVSRRRMHELRTRAREPLTLRAFEAQGFVLLAAERPRELVLGLQGAFWRPGGGLQRVAAAAFREPVPAGVARAVWSFTVEPAGASDTLLSTETRIATGDARAHRRFRAYWWLVGPGSGLIRRLMLRAVQRVAESAAQSR
jgi:hypothetical protein